MDDIDRDMIRAGLRVGTSVRMDRNLMTALKVRARYERARVGGVIIDAIRDYLAKPPAPRNASLIEARKEEVPGQAKLAL